MSRWKVLARFVFGTWDVIKAAVSSPLLDGRETPQSLTANTGGVAMRQCVAVCLRCQYAPSGSPR